MKICCISDTHGKHHKLDLSQFKTDILVHAGDFTRSSKSQTEVIVFLEWFEAQDFKYKILIAGNHEIMIEKDPDWFWEVLKRFPGITYLENSSTTIDGIKIFGSPCSNSFGNWAFMHNDSGLSRIWDEIPSDIHILISHGPAYGSGDLVNNTFSADPHVGSKSLTARKKELTELILHISGHIHEGYGVTQTGDCTNISASVLNERYKLVNDPIVIEIDI